MTGPIPTELGLLGQLLRLDFCKCSVLTYRSGHWSCHNVMLSHVIFSFIRYLNVFLIVSNDLAGPIPTELGLLSETTALVFGKLYL